MINSFKPPRSGPNAFNPVHEQRYQDMIKRSIAPMGGPLNIPPMNQMAHVQPVQNVSIPGVQPLQFNKLRAMFAKGR